MKSKRLMILDGYNLCRRYYHGMENEVSDTMLPAGTVIGWVNAVVNLTEQYRPHTVVAVFEVDKCQYRTSLHPGYKADRINRPEDFLVQIPVVEQVTEALGINSLLPRDHEADDVVAKMTVEWLEDDPHNTVLVVSSDKDFNALLMSRRVTIVKPGHGTTDWIEVRNCDVKTKYGITAAQFHDFLALTGDASDGYKGVAGIGPKTAASLLERFSTLNQVLERIDEVTPPRISALLKKNLEVVALNQKLAGFIEVPSEKIEIRSGHKDIGRALEVLQDYGLTNLSAKVVDFGDRAGSEIQ